MAAKKRSSILKSDSAQVFYTDIQTDNMLYAALIRSEESGRTVKGVYFDDLVPEEYAAFTAKDIKGKNLIVTEDTSMPVFAETVSYPGEAIGILVGPNDQLVHDYLENVHIEYEPTPEELENSSGALTEEELESESEAEEQLESDTLINEALSDEAETVQKAASEISDEKTATPVKDAVSENPISEEVSDFSESGDATDLSDIDESDYLSETADIPPEAELHSYKEDPFPEPAGDILYQRVVAAGPVEDYFAEAPHHLQSSYANRITYTPCGELSGALVSSTSRTVTFFTPTQWASHLRENASLVTGHKTDDIKIKRTICGESATNAVWYNTLLCCQAAVAAQCTQKPVKLTLTPAEQRQYIEHSPTVTIIHHAAFLDDGTISAIKTRIMVETGEGSPFVPQLIDRLAIAALGACKPFSQEVVVQAVRTPTAPTAASMQGADSLAFFALEVLFQQIALETRTNPFDVHLKNFFPGGRSYAFMADKPRTRHPYTIDTTCIVPLFEKLTNESGFFRRYAAYNTVPLTKESALSPNSVRGIGMSNSFEGHGYYGSAFDTLKQKLELTLDEDNRVIIHAREPSRSISAIWKQIISTDLSIPESQILYDPNYALSDELELPETAKGNISIQTQLIKKCCTAIQRQRSKEMLPITVKKSIPKPRSKVWDPKNFTGSPYYSVSWGCCVVELDIDSIAYEVNVRTIWIALDIGNVLNKKVAEQSVLHACHEILRNLIRHRPLQCNNIHVTLMESDSESKQIGQLMYSILPAAFANALTQSLHRAVTTLPVTDDLLYRMIQENADSSNT